MSSRRHIYSNTIIYFTMELHLLNLMLLKYLGLYSIMFFSTVKKTILMGFRQFKDACIIMHSKIQQNVRRRVLQEVKKDLDENILGYPVDLK